jgi:hypothetical protein
MYMNILISILDEELAILDKRRGLVPRSTFIRALIRGDQTVSGTVMTEDVKYEYNGKGTIKEAFDESPNMIVAVPKGEGGFPGKEKFENKKLPEIKRILKDSFAPYSVPDSKEPLPNLTTTLLKDFKSWGISGESYRNKLVERAKELGFEVDRFNNRLKKDGKIILTF